MTQFRHCCGRDQLVVQAPTEFIGAIKSKIEQSQGFTPSSQKIIFSGKLHVASRKISLT
jgi:hypothetical protein